MEQVVSEVNNFADLKKGNEGDSGVTNGQDERK
jgi:hypothetical protein